MNPCTLVRNNQDNDLNGFGLTKIGSISVNHNATDPDFFLTKSYVDSCHQENETSWRDVGLGESNNLVKNR